MKNKIIALVLVALSLSAFGFDIPKCPNPPRLVNDYIHLISPSEAQALETKLVDFNNKTSIQITVVILDDLDNTEAADVATEILRQWGVGQKGLDNGIVFLVVKYNQNAIEKLFTQKHGDWFISVGYGLESYITDYDVKGIGESEFIPFAKEDEYYQGIDATISGMMTKLGEIGWQQRQEFEAKRKVEEAENLRKLGNGLLQMVFFITIVGLLIWLFVSIRNKAIKAAALKKLKDELKANFESKKNQYLELKKKYDEVCQEVDRVKVYPSWAIEKYGQFTTKINQYFVQSVQTMLEKFTTSNDLEEMNGLFKNMAAYIFLLQSAVKGIVSVDDEVKKYHDEAPIQIQSAKDWLVDLNAKITDLTTKKYKVSEYLTQAAAFQTRIDGMDRMIKSQSNQELMLFEIATGLIENIAETIKNLDTIVSNKTETDQIIKKLNLDFETLPTMIANVQPVLDELKANYPSTSWEEVDRNFRKITNLSATCNEYKKYAEEKGTMELQEFATAKSFADKAQKNMNSVHTYCTDIQNKKAELLAAEKQFNTLLQSTQKKIDLAKNKIANDDVEKDAKTLYDSAQNSLKEAISKKAEAKVDWIIVIACLTTAGALADKAYTNAQTDITNAEKKRQDDANALKAVAAAALLAAATKRRNEENDYHSSSTQSSGGGFGGFGGGNGGGGGAGGSW